MSAVLNVLVALLLCELMAAPTPAQREVELGNQAFQEARYGDAIACYERALAKQESAVTYTNLGHAHIRLNQWGKAIEAYEAAIALEEGACGADVFRALGQAQYMDHRYDEALESFAKAGRLGAQAKDALWMARCLAESEQWSRAEDAALEYVRAHPDDTDGLELLAYVFMQGGKPGEAARIHETLVQRHPGEVRHFLALAGAQVACGEYGEAIDTLEWARRVVGDSNDEVNRLLADVYIHEGMHREAAGSYGRLVTSTDSATADDFFRLGYAYMQAGELLSAGEAFVKAREIDGGHVKAAFYLGQLAARRGDLQKADEAYGAAARAAPASPEPHAALGELYMKAGDFGRAAEEFAKAIELGQRSVAVYYNQVVTLLRARQFDKALAALKEGLHEHPFDELLTRLLDELIAEIVRYEGRH